MTISFNPSVKCVPAFGLPGTRRKRRAPSLNVRGAHETIAGILGLMLLAGACVADDLIRTIVPPFPDGWKN